MIPRSREKIDSINYTEYKHEDQDSALSTNISFIHK